MTTQLCYVGSQIRQVTADPQRGCKKRTAASDKSRVNLFSLFILRAAVSGVHCTRDVAVTKLLLAATHLSTAACLRQLIHARKQKRVYIRSVILSSGTHTVKGSAGARALASEECVPHRSWRSICHGNTANPSAPEHSRSGYVEVWAHAE